MKIRVLVVDDSVFFRNHITNILNESADLEVVGSACDGKEAIEQVKLLRPDVITMDVEMPIMDGITATREIMETQPTPILMFSLYTHEGAKATLQAIEAGAVDFLPKRFEDLAHNQEVARNLLRKKVLAVGRGREPAPDPLPIRGNKPRRNQQNQLFSFVPSLAVSEARSPVVVHNAPLPQRGVVKLVAIGTSTGGPLALQEVLGCLPAEFPVPILLIQHMPANFTATFAERLNQTCAIRVKEAEDGDVLEPGLAILAPGGRQMLVESRGVGKCVVRVQNGLPEQHYRPCVDITFRSIANRFSEKSLAIILTGMGADGREGARVLKQKGSIVWAQDEQSCVVYGMPMAVAEAGLVDRVVPLKSVGSDLISCV